MLNLVRRNIGSATSSRDFMPIFLAAFRRFVVSSTIALFFEFRVELCLDRFVLVGSWLSCRRCFDELVVVEELEEVYG